MKTKKSPTHHDRSRAQLARNLRPLVDEIVESLADVAWRQASIKLELAMSAAMSVLDEDSAAAQPAPAQESVAPPRAASKVRRVAGASPAGGRKCSACQQPGHRRPQCPSLTPAPAVEIEVDPAPEPDEHDDEPETPTAPPVAADRARRFADIEAAAARRRQEASR